MRKKVCAGALALVLVAVSVAATGELVRLTTGVQAAYTIWQTSPPIYGTETYWGGLGIDLLYRSITLSAAITIDDLETLRIPPHPAFSLGARITLLRLGNASVFLSGNLMLQPFYDAIAVYAGPGVAWSPLRFTTISVGTYYETPLRSAVGFGDCIGIWFGVSAYVPLF